MKELEKVNSISMIYLLSILSSNKKVELPMQFLPSDESLYPESQTHLKDPSMLMHLPLEHIPVSAHSSMSTQKGPTADPVNPLAQTHSNDPGVFSQRPFRQIRGFSEHSSTSTVQFRSTH